MDRSKPCAKCRRMIYASVWHTCPNEDCYYHMPCRAAPPPPAEQASGEHVEVLREMRRRAWDQAEYHAKNNQDSATARCRTQFDALGRAIAALSQRPVADEATLVEQLRELAEKARAESVNAALWPWQQSVEAGKSQAFIKAAALAQQPTGEEE